MKKFQLLLILLLCSACATMRQEVPAAKHETSSAQNEAMNDLAIYALSLADTPYRYGGNTPTNGFDCSGFVRYVFQKSLGWQLPRTSEEISHAGKSLKADQLRPGDLVFFNTSQQAFSHVGIYVGEDKFVHAPSSGKAISVVSMRDSYWRNRYDGARRITAAP